MGWPPSWPFFVPFKHSCFVSYCHGHGPLMQSFVQQLVGSLDSSLDPYFRDDQRVWFDKDRLHAGHLYNGAIAHDLCRSVCMVAVLVPKYFEQDYCRREIEAMRRIEAQRFRRIGTAPGNRGLIIPILLRGEDNDLPEAIRGHRQFCDFRAFTMASGTIARTRAFNDKIEAIARFVFDLYKSLVAAAPPDERDCDGFILPTSEEAAVWRPGAPRPAEPLLFRQERP